MKRERLSTGFIWFNPHGCIACWRCVESCQKQVIGKVKFLWHRHAVLVDREACIGCGKCTKVCPKGCFSQK